MKELELRRWHRRVGIVLAAFLVVQAASGLWLSARALVHPHGASSGGHAADETHVSPVAGFHHGGGTIGVVHRLAVGAGTLWMAGTGALIFLRIRARQRS